MTFSQRKEIRKTAANFDGIFVRNPILVSGLALPLAVVATVSLKNAAALSVAMAVSAIPTLVIASFIGQRLHYRARLLIEVLLASVLLIPAYFLVEPISPVIFDSMGIYFWLIGVSSFTLYRAEVYSVKVRPHIALLDAVVCCIGIALALFLIAGVREYLGAGTLWGVKMPASFPMQGVFIPFGGFIVVAFISAGFHFLRTKILKLLASKENRAAIK